MRNGTVLDWESLQPTTNVDILEGTLTEKKLYPFGQSCKNLMKILYSIRDEFNEKHFE